MTVCPMFVQSNMTHNIAPNWSLGVTSSEQYVDALIKSLASNKRLGIFIGPTQHTLQALNNQIALGMVLQYKFTYRFIEKYFKGVIEMQERGS